MHAGWVCVQASTRVSQLWNPSKWCLLLSPSGRVKDEGWRMRHLPLINAGLFVSNLWIFIICSTVIVLTIPWTCYSTFRNLSPPIRELIPVKACLLWRRFSHKWKKCEPVQLGKIWSSWLAGWFMCSKSLYDSPKKMPIPILDKTSIKIPMNICYH